jgi:hypothetical protein
MVVVVVVLGHHGVVVVLGGGVLGGRRGLGLHLRLARFLILDVGLALVL